MRNDAMNKKNKNLLALSERIAHKTIKKEIDKKFDHANQILGVDDSIRESVIRKSCALTRQDMENIQKIKEKALNKRIVLSDSQVIRMGIQLMSDLSERRLVEESDRMPKLSAGRPKKR